MAGEHSVPDPQLTPGDALPNLTKAAVCAPDFGSAVHLPQIELQKKVFNAYGLSSFRASYCEAAEGCIINRLIPVSLGGTNDQRNLWPMPKEPKVWGLSAKDQLEQKLHDMVCGGELTPAEAQAAIAADWISAYQTLIGEPPQE